MNTPDQHEQDWPPWERPGPVRRDCAEHRGPLLEKLGHFSAWCGALSLLTLVPSLVALPLGLVVWFMARQDLVRMSQGLTDPTGQELTTVARGEAICGICLSVIPAALLGLVWYCALSFPAW